MEWGLRAPITPRLGGNRWALPRLGKSELNEEKQTDSKHKTSDTSRSGFLPNHSKTGMPNTWSNDGP